MRTLSAQERRTIRVAALGLGIYLALFYGPSVWRFVASGTAEQQRLAQEVESFRQELQPYETRILRLEKLKQAMELEPSTLSRLALAAEASAAIQASAVSSHVKLGPIRESAARPSARELTSMRLEGVGPVLATMGWLSRLETLGYPLVIDSVQVQADPRTPGVIKLQLTIVLLDYEQWEKEGNRA